VSRCRTCGRDAERVLSQVEVLRVVTSALSARARGVPVLDYTTGMIPGRLAALQVIELMAALLDQRGFVRQEVRAALEVEELEEAWREPAAGEPES